MGYDFVCLLYWAVVMFVANLRVVGGDVVGLGKEGYKIYTAIHLLQYCYNN